MQISTTTHSIFSFDTQTSSSSFATESEIDNYLESLTRESICHRAVCHRYLDALAKGYLPNLRWAMADFARQYYGYSAHFPRYLTAVISRLENPEHRAGLLQNLTEESGVYEEEELAELQAHGVNAEWIVGVPHPKLFKRFREAVGVTDELVDDGDAASEVVCWREMFFNILTNGSPAEAIGALGLGTEGVVRHLYAPFVKALTLLPELSPRDIVFFPLHTAVDDHHQATLLGIARDYARTAESRRDLAKDMRKALALRASFWDWMLTRAETLGTSTTSDRLS